ncbi:MAG: formiminoglutamase [Patiriisocius sp.]|jgi:formiminoglutamase
MTDDISIFLNPSEAIRGLDKFNLSGTLADCIEIYDGSEFPDLKEYSVAIVGMQESRGDDSNVACSEGVEPIREALFKLYMDRPSIKIIDLGNILPGHTLSDSQFALESVCQYLIDHNTVPVVIGGAQHLTYGMYRAFAHLERMMNLAVVDATFDIGEAEDELNSKNFLSKIILDDPNYLFNYSNIGYQTYLVNPEIRGMLEKMNFDLHRLGAVRGKIDQMEPVLRGADMLSFDLSSIRKSDFPAHEEAQINGLSAEDACQLSLYAGMSDKISMVGFFGYNPMLDDLSQSAHLIGQMIWHFIDGFRARKSDNFLYDKSRFTKYLVPIEKDHEIVFYKSKQTDRWWMEVPYPTSPDNRFQRKELIPCSYVDYEEASKGEVPDRWVLTFNKLS